jgi:hypothetical protein
MGDISAVVLFSFNIFFEQLPVGTSSWEDADGETGTTPKYSGNV